MRIVQSPQIRCRAAVARCDITPPVGIYHRMWGAATHDRATGVHRPLLATLLWLEPRSGDAVQALLLVALDHCILDQPDVELIQRAAADTAGVRGEQVLVTLAHTHAAGLMSRSRSALPGGELIGPYLDELAVKVGRLAAQAAAGRQPATVVYGRGRCDLAANRDYFDDERGQFVCGYNSAGPADDTLIVAKVQGNDGSLIATVVNYACHPTTLAWQNTLISPDYVGALRETIEGLTGAPCPFLQGASGDLGPRDGFVGDTAVADRNGRQIGYAALAALESLPPPGTKFVYAGPVVSGATIGTWRHEPVDEASLHRQAKWDIAQWDVPLRYRPDLPTYELAAVELRRWQDVEEHASAAGNAAAAMEAHAQVERANRQLWRLSALPPGRFPLRVTVARLGGAFWLFVQGEHYQVLQTTLRSRFPKHSLLVATLTGGWQPGYIPPADIYGRGIYQEQIAVVAAGSAEEVIAAISARIENLASDSSGG